MQSIYSNRFCRQPWSFVEVQGDGNIYNCCPGWITKPLGNILEQSWEEVWNGKVAQEYRQSMLDSTFKNCIKENCAHLLSDTLREGSPVFEKKDLNILWRKLKTIDNTGPLVVNLCYDRSCNLSCPSCRDELVMNSPKSYEWNNIEKIHKIVMDEIIKDAYRLYITGTGDPFASPFFRSFLQEFDSKKYPKIGMIHLHTNGTLWTKSMWESMKNVHPLVKSVEISIDASTRETYEIVRRNGDWDMLMDNLDYINTLDTIEEINLSFVVQNINYKEIFDFEKLKDKLNNIPRVRTHYYKLLDWGHMSNFKESAVWKSEHKNYSDFIKVWNEFVDKTDKDCMTHTIWN
jgi:MoaA/NifB/PqqE/SkfB family radical SAM enzyme